MNNATVTNSFFTDYSLYDMELINTISSGCSFIATCIILIKVLDVPSFFSKVRERRALQKRAKERRELERVRKLINSVKAHGDVVDIDELLSDDDDEETQIDDRGVMKIAHRKGAKKKSNEEKI
jgi:hypothetical protein